MTKQMIFKEDISSNIDKVVQLIHLFEEMDDALFPFTGDTLYNSKWGDFLNYPIDMLWDSIIKFRGISEIDDEYDYFVDCLHKYAKKEEFNIGRIKIINADTLRDAFVFLIDLNIIAPKEKDISNI